MTLALSGQTNWQTSFFIGPVAAPRTGSIRILGAEIREDHALTDLKRELIALLPRLRRFARSLTRSVPEADDLVQEACLRALSRSDQWDPTQPLDRWMFRITRNLWISEIRKRTVRLGQGHVPAEEAHELVAQETGEAAAAATELRDHIAALPEELSTILLTVSVEGYSYAEAAELFEIPIGTVMSRIHRARKTLAKQMAEPAGAST
ncbi:RNA polymerase sigma factor [uncultured Roseovarius sp.]|uniref:RNA polymerase sigma factor n=1 Tax=uncultured Roseovarius sp. TaxID=293344 RepID=UPI00261407FC|nr:RNA polymerase sigma factor [uncultured Roseovarius sp.]